jgi:hypothetical protein
MFCNTAVFPAWVKASALLITITAVFLDLLWSDHGMVGCNVWGAHWT